MKMDGSSVRWKWREPQHLSNPRQDCANPLAGAAGLEHEQENDFASQARGEATTVEHQRHEYFLAKGSC